VNDAYVRTVQLLLDIAPAVFETPVFAMKGGTALNLFVQDMPRLSVDIDVVFVPYDLPREDALLPGVNYSELSASTILSGADGR
jgi:predicted nucleotidyltransferase component of viral defense system